MTTAAILKLITSSLAPWAQQNQGSVEVANDLNHLFAILSIKPGGFRAGVHCVGEDKRGIYEEGQMVDREFWIALAYGRSLQLNKGDALVYGQSGGRPMFDIIEECRDQVRAINFDSQTTEAMCDYKGYKPLQAISPDFLIDGFYLRITLGVLLQGPGQPSQTPA